MTEDRSPRRGRLAHEALGLLLLSLLLSLGVLWLLSLCSGAVARLWLEARSLVPTEVQLIRLNSWLSSLSLLGAVGFAAALFLLLLGERLSYISLIIRGVDGLREGQLGVQVPLRGCNELTQMAQAVNDLSAAQQALRAREQALSEEREQLIRTLSHDIRTPLTSILSYSELLAGQMDCPPEQRAEYLALIRRKAEQIRELTALLLEGGSDAPQWFDDGRLLMEQLCEEFSEGLEDDFTLQLELDGLPPFSGSFALGELRRIFDNLASNVRKYAHPAHPVVLSVTRSGQGPLRIVQRNHCRPDGSEADSHGLGLISIRRIAHRWGGRVEAGRSGDQFFITVELSEF